MSRSHAPAFPGARCGALCALLATLLAIAPTHAQVNSGSDGSDGPLLTASNIVFDLSQAPTGVWSDPAPSPGDGIYDPDLHAVVFKFTEVSVRGVTFVNHPSGASVVWLVQGDVTLTSGTIDLAGAAGPATNGVKFLFPEPGPGGFAGGAGPAGEMNASGGFGPGGGPPEFPGSHATSGSIAGSGPTYGAPSIPRLRGGSGGGGGGTHSGGAGGGAFMIVAEGTISSVVSSIISVRGGNSASRGAPGSGGAIRLVGTVIDLTGVLDARGGDASGVAGGDGYIRLESDTLLGAGTCFGSSSVSSPQQIFPDANAPQLRILAIGPSIAPLDPNGSPSTIDMVVTNDGQPITIQIEANNVPIGFAVTILVQQTDGPTLEFLSNPLSGSLAQSNATAVVTLPPGPLEIQLRVDW